MQQILLRIFRSYKKRKHEKYTAQIKQRWYEQGQIPWQEGYVQAKEDLIEKYINDDTLYDSMSRRVLPTGYGYRMDERIVEYPWILSKLSTNSCPLLDAGSTFNFPYLVSHPRVAHKELSIYTYYPEPSCFYQNRISYQFGDLRNILYRTNYFEEIVCQSTLEHIDMDNSIYGYELTKTTSAKSYDYLLVIAELERILRPGGLLLLTFPYGRFEHHGFFQQFDKEMVDKIDDYLSERGTLVKDFFKYEGQGWRFAQQADCELAESYNPHTGKGHLADQAAHSRAICCLQFVKKP